MEKKKLSKVIVLLAFLILLGFHPLSVQADEKVSIVTDNSKASVQVTISDSSLDGKEVSVVCYSPSWNGSFSDQSDSQKYIVYLNQYKINGETKFNFRVKEQLVKGEYSLVIGSTNGKVMKRFRFFSQETPKSTQTPNQTSSETNKLPAPRLFKAVQSGTKQVTLTWEKVTGAKAYDIYRSAKASSGFNKIGTTTATSYRDKKASAGKTWYYKVAAIGATAAINSNKSNVAKVLVLKAPSINVKSTAKRKAVATWKKVNGAKGYQVSVATKKSGKYKVKLTLKGASKTRGIIKKLKSKKTYYIKVRAYTNVRGKRILGKYSKVHKVKVR